MPGANYFDSLDITKTVDSVLDGFSEHFFESTFEDLSNEDQRRVLTCLRNDLTERVAAMGPKPATRVAVRK